MSCKLYYPYIKWMCSGLLLLDLGLSGRKCDSMVTYVSLSDLPISLSEKYGLHQNKFNTLYINHKRKSKSTRGKVFGFYIYTSPVSYQSCSSWCIYTILITASTFLFCLSFMSCDVYNHFSATRFFFSP